MTTQAYIYKPDDLLKMPATPVTVKEHWEAGRGVVVSSHETTQILQRANAPKSAGFTWGGRPGRLLFMPTNLWAYQELALMRNEDSFSPTPEREDQPIETKEHHP